ncbi:MAG: DUF983 domain-containing protein [Alphaproteobacteria bacterium]|nr:DUF983 domain-containing protein [Alphaproteobacteria bacterium]
MTENGDTPPVSSLKAGLMGRCPCCGVGKLFAGFLQVAETCGHCGLGLKSRDTGDGPAVFVALIVGGLVVALALIVEVSYQPPFWLHALLWIPLILVLSLGLLRPLKALFYAINYDRRPDLQ